MIWFNTFLALLSLLTILPAPALPFWYAAVLATEWGHYLCLLAVGCAIIAGFPRRWTAASMLALSAAALFTTPVLRALPVAGRLPRELAAAFPVRNDTIPRPLNWVTLIIGRHRRDDLIATTLAYPAGDGAALAMDVFRPRSRQGRLPGVVVVHGGGWHLGSRKEFESLNRWLASCGYVVASVDYRLAPSAKFPAPIDDVRSAIATLKKKAAEIGLDSTRLVVMGRSAGGEIALATAYGAHDPAIQGVIAIYAPSDLVWGYAYPTNPLIMDSQQLLRNYIGGTPQSRPQDYEAASPLFAVNAKTPPTLMIHGLNDEVVSPHHNDRLIARLAPLKRPYYYLRLPWGKHGCDMNLSGPGGQLSIYAIERFLLAVLATEA